VLTNLAQENRQLANENALLRAQNQQKDAELQEALALVPD